MDESYHLEGKPEFAVDLYHRFLALVESNGPVTLAVSKTAVSIKGSRRGFAGARPTSTGLRGFLDLQHPIHDARFGTPSPYGRRLFVNHFRLTSPSQLDEQFADWVAEAYAVGQGEHLRSS